MFRVTRCGEFSPFWQKEKSFRQYFVGLFSIGTSFETTLPKYNAIGQSFIVVNVQNSQHN